MSCNFFLLLRHDPTTLSRKRHSGPPDLNTRCETCATTCGSYGNHSSSIPDLYCFGKNVLVLDIHKLGITLCSDIPPYAINLCHMENFLWEFPSSNKNSLSLAQPLQSQLTKKIILNHSKCYILSLP